MSARDLETIAARWLMRQEEPGWSAQDQQILNAWLNESMAHKAVYWRLEHGWQSADRIQALGTALPAKASTGLGRLQRWWKPAAIAASVALVLWGAAMQIADYTGTFGAAQTRFDTAVGDRKVIAMEDGSRIELNTTTALRTAISDGKRQVWLDKGEAFFDVRHRNGQPFIVYAGEKTITVLGTKFSVLHDGEKVVVSVLEGRVRVQDGADKASRSSEVVLTNGTQALASNAATLITEPSAERVKAALAWREGLLKFDQATLGEAANQFNRYNRQQIVIKGEQTAMIRIGGTFRADNVDAFVRLLHEAYGLDIAANDNRIEISE